MHIYTADLCMLYIYVIYLPKAIIYAIYLSNYKAIVRILPNLI